MSIEKKKLLARLALAIACFVLPGTLWAEPVTITIENDTDAGIFELFVATPDSDEWEEVVFDADSIEPGESLVVTIMDGRRDCLYDLLVGFDDDTELEIYDVEVCEGDAYVISSE